MIHGSTFLVGFNFIDIVLSIAVIVNITYLDSSLSFFTANCNRGVLLLNVFTKSKGNPLPTSSDSGVTSVAGRGDKIS